MPREDNAKAIEQKEYLTGIFDRAADTYGQVGPPVFEYFGHRLVEFVSLKSGYHVLDVATGRGAVLIPAASTVGPNGKVVGIDLAEGMVRQTAAIIANSNIFNTEVRLMDAENLEFPENSFDAVLCGLAIFFFPRPFKAVAQFRRVLKPGGCLALTSFGELLTGEWRWLPTLIKKYLATESTTPLEDEPAVGADPKLDSQPGLQAFLVSAGFEQVQIKSENPEFVYADENEWWATMWSVGIRGSFERIESIFGQEALQRFQAESFEQLAHQRQKDGIHQRFPVFYASGVKPVEPIFPINEVVEPS